MRASVQKRVQRSEFCKLIRLKKVRICKVRSIDELYAFHNNTLNSRKVKELIKIVETFRKLKYSYKMLKTPMKFTLYYCRMEGCALFRNS